MVSLGYRVSAAATTEGPVVVVHDGSRHSSPTSAFRPIACAYMGRDRNGGFPKSCGPGLSGCPILVNGAHGLRCPASLRHALPRRIRLGHQSFGVTAPDWIPARIIPPRNLRSPKASRSGSAPEPHEWTVRRRSILETGSSGRSFRSMWKQSKEHEAASFSLMASLRPESRRH